MCVCVRACKLRYSHKNNTIGIGKTIGSNQRFPPTRINMFRTLAKNISSFCLFIDLFACLVVHVNSYVRMLSLHLCILRSSIPVFRENNNNGTRVAIVKAPKLGTVHPQVVFYIP